VSLALPGAAAAASLEPAEHDAADGIAEEVLSFRQGFLQAGTFFKFRFVDGRMIEQLRGNLATNGPRVIDFERKTGGAADWKRGQAIN